MTADGFLTFLALLVAVYAIAPPVEKLRLRLQQNIFMLTIASLSLLLVLYFLLFDAFKQPCLKFLQSHCKIISFTHNSAFTPSDAAFIVVLVGAFAVWVVHRVSRNLAPNLSIMESLVEELIVEKRFVELSQLVSRHLDYLSMAATRKLKSQKLYDNLLASRGTSSLENVIGLLDQQGLEQKNKTSLILFKFLSPFKIFFPSQRKLESHAKNILRTIYTNDELIFFIVKQRPYFGVLLLGIDEHGWYDFSDLFLTNLLAQERTVLYREVRNNQSAGMHGYIFDEHNKLLYFLFADIKNADRLKAWKPIGECILRKLSAGEQSEYIDFLMGPSTYFEDERWSDPTFIGLEYFSMMVTAAAHQNHDYHMWLYYLPLILEKLEKQYDISNSEVDIEAEFPNRAARLIYDIISMLGEFVELARNLPEDSYHIKVPDNFEFSHKSIPASAAIALGQSLKTIITSDRLNDKFVCYMHECVMRDIRELPVDGETGKLRAFLINSVIRGGDAVGFRRHDDSYLNRLHGLIFQADHVLRYDTNDYENAVRTELSK